MHIILRRAGQLRRRQKLLRAMRAEGACAAACAALLALVFTHMPAPEALSDGASPYGSLIFASRAAGVVIGVLSFALGVCVTLLCLHRRRLRETEPDHEA